MTSTHSHLVLTNLHFFSLFFFSPFHCRTLHDGTFFVVVVVIRRLLFKMKTILRNLPYIVEPHTHKIEVICWAVNKLDDAKFWRKCHSKCRNLPTHIWLQTIYSFIRLKSISNGCFFHANDCVFFHLMEKLFSRCNIVCLVSTMSGKKANLLTWMGYLMRLFQLQTKCQSCSKPKLNAILFSVFFFNFQANILRRCGAKLSRQYKNMSCRIFSTNLMCQSDQIQLECLFFHVRLR